MEDRKKIDKAIKNIRRLGFLEKAIEFIIIRFHSGNRVNGIPPKNADAYIWYRKVPLTVKALHQITILTICQTIQQEMKNTVEIYIWQNIFLDMTKLNKLTLSI